MSLVRLVDYFVIVTLCVCFRLPDLPVFLVDFPVFPAFRQIVSTSNRNSSRRVKQARQLIA